MYLLKSLFAQAGRLVKICGFNRMNMSLQLTRLGLLPLAAIACFASSLSAAFHGDPPDANHPWAVHDNNRPQPVRVEPAAVVGGAPSDAVVLFDGSEASLTNWTHVKPDGKRKGDWIVQDGALQCVPGAGYIASKEEFGDCQLHVEWAAPTEIKGAGQGRGNSGVFLMGQIEVQVLDNYNNPSYPDGSAGAVYGVMPPAANALRAPGQWQSYDIIFRRPIVRDGVLLDEGSMTVLVNGVVVQDSTPLEGGGGHKKRKALNHAYPDAGPLRLQDHGNPVRYRNIWVRPLRPRPADGGTDGRLSEAATTAKRAEIAVDLRARAAGQDGSDQMMTLLEAYLYDGNEAAWAECDRQVTAYVQQLKQLSAEELKQRRRDVLHLHHALHYMQRFDLIPSGYEPAKALQEIADAQGWLKK
jgi:hypothetical protein